MLRANVFDPILIFESLLQFVNAKFIDDTLEESNLERSTVVRLTHSLNRQFIVVVLAVFNPDKSTDSKLLIPQNKYEMLVGAITFSVILTLLIFKRLLYQGTSARDVVSSPLPDLTVKVLLVISHAHVPQVPLAIVSA